MLEDAPARSQRHWTDSIWWGLAAVAGLFVLAVAGFLVAFSIGSRQLEHELGYWVRVNLPDGFSGCTALLFNHAGAPPTRVEDPLYVVDLPADGRWDTSTNLNWGETLKFKYYYRTHEGWKRVLPNTQTGGAVQYKDGSVDAGGACFKQPLTFGEN